MRALVRKGSFGAVIACVGFGVCACGSGSGNVRVMRGLDDLSKYEACALEVDETGLRDGSHAREVVQAQLRSDLASHGVCELRNDGDLIIRMSGRLNEVKGSSDGAGLEGQDYVAVFDVALSDRAGKRLGSFRVEGTTKEDVHTSVAGGVKTISGKKQDIALRNAAEQVAKTIQEKRGGGRPIRAVAPPPEEPVPPVAALQEPAPAPSPTPAPASAPTPPPTGAGVLPGCSLVCTNAHRSGRPPPAEEQRVAQSLSAELDMLHSCHHGGAAGTMTMRFDSQGNLTHFGVDPDESDPSCLDAVRSRHPQVTFPGPATLRCSERCRK